MSFEQFREAIQRIKDLPQNGKPPTDAELRKLLAVIDAKQNRHGENAEAAQRMATLNTPALRIGPDGVR